MGNEETISGKVASRNECAPTKSNKSITDVEAEDHAGASFWETRLGSLHPIQLPYESCHVHSKCQYATSSWYSPQLVTAGRDPQKMILDAFVIYLLRLTNQTELDLGVSLMDSVKSTSTLKDRINVMPMVIKASLNEPWGAVSKVVDEELALLDRFSFRSFTVDPKSIERPSWRIVLSLVNGQDDYWCPDSVSEGELLTLRINEFGNFRWAYDSNSLDADLIHRMSDHLTILVNRRCNEVPISKLSLLSETEQQLLLRTWNATKEPFPENICIHHLIEQRAAKSPIAIALVCGGQSMTYAELNVRANRVAHELRRLGIGPDNLVPICMKRSTSLIVGIFGILKAGAGCVPLDTAYPRKRLLHILEDANPTVVVADEVGRATLGEETLTPFVVLDVNDLKTCCDSNPQVPGLTTRNLSYVTYTSGSTGIPKGVMVEHRGLVNSTMADMKRFEASEKSKMLTVASISFDVSLADIFMALASGASLHISTDSMHLDPRRIWSYMEEHDITHVSMTPSILQDGTSLPKISNKPVLILTAEGPSIQLVRKLSREMTIYNAYGSTENTIYATVWSCPSNYTGEVILMGKPMPNVTAYVLDPYGELVPLGAIGELYIGGAGVCRGYLNRPAQTSQRFLPNPFSDQSDARLYRTGDLVRYLPDGNLVFVGRDDHVIKIRGFRIEPGEIESCLSSVPGDLVREALIVVDGEDEHKRLIAYVVSNCTSNLPQILHDHLVSHLPEYMVPSVFVQIDAFPLLPTGKVDRKALPAPNEDSFVQSTYEAPQNVSETTLCSVWSELFGIQRIGRHDSFFSLGGHSLLAVRMIERLQHQGLTLSVRDIYEHPILCELSRTLKRQKSTTAPPNVLGSSITSLTPNMLPLIDLTQNDIDVIISRVDGGLKNLQDVYALSPLQDGILFHHLLATEGDPYLLRGKKTYNDRGTLDRYLQAIRKVVKRHDILRSAFIWKGLSRPAQVVWRRVEFSVEELQLSSEDGPISDQLNTLYDPRHFRMDLTRAPLLRFVVTKNSDGSWTLMQLMHHLIGDHITLERMQAEVQACLSGRMDELPDPIPFREIVSRLRLGVTQDTRAQFFSKMLADIDEPTFPFGLDEVYGDGTDLNQTHRILDPELNHQLREQAKQTGVSMAVLCHVAFAQVLARSSGRDQVVFGTVLSGRVQADVCGEEAMGLLMNTLPFRVDVDDGSVRDRVRETHERLAGLLDHEQASLVLAQGCSSLPTGTPLFSALLNYRHATLEANSCAESIGVEAFEDEERTNYPLTISVDDYESSLALTVLVMNPVEATKLCGYMEQALASLANALQSAPLTPIRTLEVLPERERRMLLEEWNVIEPPKYEEACMHKHFEGHVARRPEAVALIDEGQTLTYQEVNSRANRLAHRLVHLGVQPDQLVAICVERSTATIIGMLAILKAGGAYMPLDPLYPQDRLANIVKDARPKVMLADKAGLDALGESLTRTVTVLDPNTLPNEDTSNPEVAELSPRNLAYIIYTSGSTGKPKGVTVEHRHIVRLFDSTESWFHFGHEDTWCMVNSISFDFSVWEVWGALRWGGKLVITSQDVARSPRQLQKCIQQHGVTVLNQTPSAFRSFTETYTENPEPDRLRYILCGGEPLDPLVLQSWYSVRREPSPQLGVMYGTTETSVVSTYRLLDPSDACLVQIPIGKRVPDMKVYILDARGQPVPLGALGELYIGGKGVARGYLDRDKLTAERFVADPFDSLHGRMYKTGDLVRYLPDANVVFVGRKDEQIKVRGFRIEPGEIEACLALHPEVQQALVILTGNGEDKRLVAYVVAKPIDDLAQRLRDHAAASLPEYMVPSAFVRLDGFPLMPSGKVDRKALPAPDSSALARRTYEAPRGALENALASIWSELLNVESISRHDSFGALGGHSLLAVRLMSRIGGLGVDLPLSAIFASRSLVDLAEVIRSRSTNEMVILPPITPIERSGLLPLSFAQQRLWFVAQTDAVETVYNIHIGLRLRGSFDEKAWQRALNELYARHEALRSVFISVNGEPKVRLLDAESGIHLQTHDLRGTSDVEMQLMRIVAQEAHEAFDLRNGPLIRARLIQLADEERVFLLTQHHIVSDGWSIGVLLRELSLLYPAFLDGQPSPLPEMRIQYPDYAAWQRKWLSVDRLQIQSNYWRSTLASAPVLLDLPTDRPRPARQSYIGSVVPIALDPELTTALQGLSQRHDTTLFTTILSAWATVLSRLSGQDDIVVGAPSAYRTRQEIESLIGFFVNMLALRVDLSGSPSVADLLKRVKHTALTAQDHQDIPFEHVVEIVQPTRKLSHSPIFQVMFAWHNNENTELTLPDLEVSTEPEIYDAVQFDLELNLSQVNDQIVGGLAFSTALFDPETIVRHADYLRTTLRAMVSNDLAQIGKINLLAPAERTLLLRTWNATETSFPEDLCLHQLFEQQVARVPKSIALVCEDQVLTYDELNARANALAHRLVELGVGPEQLVVLCTSRSPAMIIGLLAILKTGGAYVPLDPAYPSQRLVHILKDAAPSVVLADQVGLSALGRNSVANLMVLDPSTHHDYPHSNPNPRDLTSRRLSYVIYTSGSTGVPKGVMIEHRGVVNLTLSQMSRFEVQPTSRVLQFVSISFDVSAGEIMMALGCGAALHIAVDAIRQDPNNLWGYIQKQGITHASLTPAFLRDSSTLPTFKTTPAVILSGEAPNPVLMRNLCNQVRLFNAYGPTECTIYASSWHCPENYQQDLIPIGRPFWNTRLYILDRHGEPVPKGSVGELYIGGIGVARGYLNRPELSEEKFVPDPFSEIPGARMYKTGDLARYQRDSNIAYLGRNDEQVKIRGFRIELGEIKACLRSHSRVSDALVTTFDHENDKRLVAYVVTDGIDNLAQTLRTHLMIQLPDYMVPSAFVRLDKFPLSPNGKLDVRALPAPSQDAFVRQSYEAPQNEVERTLTTIWGELLGLDRVSRNDSFFELGGHSLIAIRMVERLRGRGLTIAVRDLFQCPVLFELAKTIKKHHVVPVPPNVITSESRTLTPDMLPLIDLTQAEIDSIVEQVPGGISNVQDIYALSPLQDGILFHHLLATEGDPYVITDQKTFTDRNSLDRYLWAAHKVVERHDILRTAFMWESLSVPAQVVLRKAPLTPVELELSSEKGLVSDQLKTLFNPVESRMDVRQAPLMRLAISKDGDNGWVLLLQIHHLIADQATLRIMHIEIHSYFNGQGDELPTPKPFRNLVAQMRLDLNQDSHTAFFSKMLADVQGPTLPFGFDEVYHGGLLVQSYHRMLTSDLNTRLRGLAKRMGVSVAALCHLAFARVISSASGREQVVFGTVLSGRMQVGVSDVTAMGLYINTLPLRVNVGDAPVQSCVREMHTQLAELMEHEHASLALAQRCSGVPSGGPLFSALLNYRHHVALEGSEAVVDAELFGGEERTNYPLMLSVEDCVEALGLTVQVTDPVEPSRLCAYMECTLENLVDALESEPMTPVKSLEIIPNVERKMLLETWNATEVSYPENSCLHEVFEWQASKTPNAVAVVCEGRSLTYSQLNTRANRLAHELKSLGVVPDQLVALCVERSIAMIVGLLGILKAGGAYVPLDPAYPSQRLVRILKDAHPRVVVADKTGRKVLGTEAIGTSKVVDPNSLREDADGSNSKVAELTSRNLAYVIYTSGSTGLPNGVMIEHRSIVNLALAQMHRFEVQPDSRVLQFVSLSFDISAGDITMAIVCGASLHIAVGPVRQDPAVLWSYMRENRITHVSITPSFLQDTDVASLPTTPVHPTIMLVGEASSPARIEMLRGRANIYDAYGPTECTVCAAAWHCPEDFSGKVVPVGRPIANMKLYVLDEDRKPVLLGGIGELYIGGIGVARGYLNRPDLTQERFVADPFCKSPEARMYKTGDRAYYLPNGNLAYLGRIDHQIKVRGFRIEPGEIEACLSAHNAVREVVVTTYGKGDAKRLVAYVVSDEMDDLARTLRAYSADNLPDYMVPSAFVRLDRFPVTPVGKLDRKALPEPDSDAIARKVYEAPRDDIEIALAAIWSELLKVDKVGRRDSFFALGGHSLLAVRLMSRISCLGVELPLSTIFATTSLAGLAEVIRSQLATTTSMLPAIRKVELNDQLPLSFAQQRLWFIEQLDGIGEIHNIFIPLRLRGSLNVKEWKRALDELYTRHDVLRSVFLSVGGQPKARLLDAGAGMPLQTHDLRGASDAEAQLKRIVSEEAHEAFDLRTGPLVRARLIQLADEERVFLLTQHHIVSDGWSIGVLLRELSLLYPAFLDGQPSPLPEMRIQYPDYAAWQRKWLSVDRLQVQSNYWRQTLASAPALLNLPTDRPRPARQSYVGGVVPILLDEELTTGLQSLSQEHDATVFMTILAAWATVLSRLSGDDDIVIGVPCANRTRPEVETLVGFFVNMLALRVDLSGVPSVTELLKRVRNTALRAQDHQDVPFEHVVEMIQPVRNLSHTAIFQVAFGWHNNETTELKLPQLEVSTAVQVHDVVQFDLELNLSQVDNTIVGSLGFSTALFDSDTIMRQVEYLRATLRAMVSNARQPVERINLLTLPERTLLLETWNATDTPFPDHLCIHQLFEQQVVRTPNATALVCEDQVLTYNELNTRANALAHRLQELGVVPDQLVVLSVSRSPAMIIGLLAILKAGGAYVPVDPAYRSHRLLQILKDADPRVVVADRPGLAVLSADTVSTKTVLDPNEMFDHLPTDNPKVAELTPRHLAYIIYTSGSTGTPKGVMVEHRGVVNFAISGIARFDVTDSSKLFMQSSISFDASIGDIGMAFGSGATLHIPIGPIRQDPTLMWNYMKEHDVTHALMLTPSFLRDATNLPSMTNLPTAVIGGEVISPALLKNLRDHANIYVAYGSTECSIWSASWSYRSDQCTEHVPIGGPIRNTRLYLLDEHGDPVPLGATGEIYIGGVGVARGYLNRPDVTEQRFLRDPFTGNSEDRMYRTGDLARYLPDGNLVFVGRNDEQVKIRGFRIEPGEIETCLTGYPAVREALVTTFGDEDDKRLVAYVVADEIDDLARTLRAHLSVLLPDFMVPSAFVSLGEFPLTPNGKLDHRALPEPDQSAFARPVYETPRGNVETVLAATWSDLLGVEQVSRRDNFFSLGGHSLLAVRLKDMAAARGVLCTLNDVFQAPVLVDLAARITQHMFTRSCIASTVIPVRTEGTELPVFFVPTANGDFSYAFALGRDIETNCPIYALPSPSIYEAQATTINELASKMVDLIKTVQAKGPYRLCGYSSAGVLAYATAQLLMRLGDAVSFLGLIDAAAPRYHKTQGTKRRHLILAELLDGPGTIKVKEMTELYQKLDHLSVAEVVDAAQRMELYPSSMCTDLLVRQIEQKLAYLRMFTEHVPNTLPVTIHQFYAIEPPPPVPFATDIDLSFWVDDRTLGWGDIIVDDTIRLIPIPGDHITMLNDMDRRTYLGQAVTNALATS